MTHDSRFDSAWLKWGWAVRHAESLQTEIGRAAEDADRQPLITTSSEYDSQRHSIILTVASIQPIPPTWGLRLGDVAHGFRNSLDHLAWALVQRGQTHNLSAKQSRRVQFPIFMTRAEFNGSLKTNLPGVRLADIAKVRRCQPYHRGRVRLF